MRVKKSLTENPCNQDHGTFDQLCWILSPRRFSHYYSCDVFQCSDRTCNWRIRKLYKIRKDSFQLYECIHFRFAFWLDLGRSCLFRETPISKYSNLMIYERTTWHLNSASVHLDQLFDTTSFRYWTWLTFFFPFSLKLGFDPRKWQGSESKCVDFTNFFETVQTNYFHEISNIDSTRIHEFF